MPEKRLMAVQAISHEGIEVRIYPVEQGYRVVVSSLLNEYWHPGIFPDVQALWDWLHPQLEALAEDGLPLAGELSVVSEQLSVIFPVPYTLLPIP